MPSTDSIDFLQILKTRREHLRSLLKLSARQSELIDHDDYTQLLTVLGRKQRILGRLDEIHSRYPQFEREWKKHRDAMDAGVRKQCESILVDTKEILSELLDTENESTGFLTHRRDETKKQLEALSRGTRTQEAYRDSMAPITTRHLDINQ